jgi:hypothetical protein
VKTIRLDRLVLHNFKGFTFDLDTGVGDTDIYGANATGKTTIADAFSWLLFDKDSLGRADFEIKNLDTMGQEEHGLEHSVEGALDVDGTRVILKKTYREIWTKKRGSATALYTGNTTDYFLDGVPTQKKEYTQRVAELAGDETVFRLLTTPTAFPALHWTKQRALLLDICGDLTDAQVIESDAALSALPEILGNKTIEDYRKIIAAKRAEINNELVKIPVRIDEVKRGMPDVAGLDREAITADVALLERSLSDARLKLQGIDNGATIAELSKKLAVVNNDIQGVQQEHYLEKMKEVNRLDAQIAGITDANAQAGRRAQGIKDDMATKSKRVDALDTELEKLRARWISIDADQFSEAIADTCYACGQALPSDRVEEAREKAFAEFNRRKAERLTEVEMKGKDLATEKQGYVAAIMDLRDTAPTADSVKDGENIQHLFTQRDAAKKAAEDYSGIERLPALMAHKVELEGQITAAKQDVAEDHEEQNERVSAISDQLAVLKADAAKFMRREAGEARVKELKAEEKKLATEYERLEKELYLTEQFVRTKVSLLEARINGKFELVRFRLFETQVNQGLSETCQLTINGIPYLGGLNSAARAQGGMDIIRTLQTHYKLSVPCFVDNRESVTELPAMDCQIVSLYVSPEDPVLRVKIARESKKGLANNRLL